MINPRGVQFAPLGIQDQFSSGEKPLNRCRRCWCSQVPEQEFQCKCQDNLLWVPGMNDPSRPAKHPEILTLALPRPSPKDFDPCPTPPQRKKNLPRPSLVGTRKSQNFTSLPMTPGQHQQGLSQLKKVPSFPTRPGIPHLVAPKTGHCPPNLPQIWCCSCQLQLSTTEYIRFCCSLLYPKELASSCLSVFRRLANCCQDSSTSSELVDVDLKTS